MKRQILFTLLLFLVLVLFSLFLFNKKDVENDIRIEVCEDITSGRLKVVCYGMFLKNHTFCSLAQDFSSYCYDSVFPLIDLNETFCESLDDAYAKLSCFSSLAFKSRNGELCELLKDSTLIDICYTRLVEHLSYFDDPSFCNKIPHESTRFICLARITDDINFCSNITQEIEERSMCLGILTKNVSYCTIKPTGTLSRIVIYSCIRSVATDLGDISLCDRIDYEEEKWKCKTSLSESIDICDEAWGPWKDFCKVEYIKNNIFAEKS